MAPAKRKSKAKPKGPIDPILASKRQPQLAGRLRVGIEQIQDWMASPEAVMRVKAHPDKPAEWMTFEQYLASQGFERAPE